MRGPRGTIGLDRHSVRAERPLRHEAVVTRCSAFRVEQPPAVVRSKVRGFSSQQRTEAVFQCLRHNAIIALLPRSRVAAIGARVSATPPARIIARRTSTFAIATL